MDTNMNKLVSILLPTYNGADRIKEAMESVCSQFYGAWELLVLDDGSNDYTKQVVLKVAKTDLRIRYIKNETNLGIQKTLNKGLQEARGEYIGRIDDDDVWIDKEKLNKQIEFLEKNNEHVLVGTGFVAVDENGEEIFNFTNPARDEDIRKKILNKNCFLHSSVMFRKSMALECGGYPETEATKHIEDYVLWLKLGTLGKFANLATPSVRFTFRDESLSSKNKIIQFERCLQIIKPYRTEYPNYFQAWLGLTFRMIIYKFFKLWPFNYLYKKFYTLYKKF
jgi:glycosyltransferase involved in cell wall biosynthesis